MKLYCIKCKKTREFKGNNKDGYYNNHECLICGYKYNKDSKYSAWQIYAYSAECENCKSINELYTQPADCPEYTSDVYCKCNKCGELVRFNLPVN